MEFARCRRRGSGENTPGALFGTAFPPILNKQHRSQGCGEKLYTLKIKTISRENIINTPVILISRVFDTNQIKEITDEVK